MICPHGHDEGVIERLATPEEVDAGCELGLAYDPCPECAAKRRWTPEMVEAQRKSLGGPRNYDEFETLLGVPDYDFQAETGQGPPA